MGATGPAVLPATRPLRGRLPGASAGIQLPRDCLVLPCSEFGVPAAGTYRLMSQDFLTPPRAHNSEDRLLRRHPNPLAIVLRFGGDNSSMKVCKVSRNVNPYRRKM